VAAALAAASHGESLNPQIRNQINQTNNQVCLLKRVARKFQDFS